MAGRFTVERTLHAGEAARVFAARDATTGEAVALKVVRDDVGPTATERLRREARLLARFALPGLVARVDDGDFDGHAYLATRLVEGPTLARRVADDGPLGVEDTLASIRALAETLTVLHREGVVHRDLSPANVLLAEGDPRRPVLLDLGAAREAHGGETAAGVFVGTPGHVAPEQVRGGADLDARVDVWGLGALLHFCLTGSPPLPGRTTTTLLSRVLFEDPPWLLDVRADVPPRVAAFAERLLARARDERPSDAAQVLAALEALDGAPIARPAPPAAGTLLVASAPAWPAEAVARALEDVSDWSLLPDRTLVAFCRDEAHAVRAAEAALAVQRAVPEAQVALAGAGSPGEASDRIDALGEGAPRLDDATEAALRATFVTRSDAGAVTLVGPRDPDVRAGAVLADRYVLEAPLGTGGMGEVWSARHRALGSKVAVKLLHGSLAEHPDLRRRFLDEARITARLDSAHAVRVFDFGVTPGGRPFLAMERIDGAPLSDAIARGALSPTRTLTLLGQAARALDRAHALGIVHRDLKPHNVLVTRDEDGHEVAKLVDFGIAKIVGGLADALDGAAAPSDVEATRAGLGTPAYMAPEQIRGEDVGPAADRFALGVVAHQCLTGHLPWRARDVPGTFAEILAGRAPAPVESLPTAFTEWLARACAARPDARFPSARESVEALAAALGVSPAAAAADPLRPSPRRSSLVVALALAAAIGVGWLSRRPDPPRPAPATSASTPSAASATTGTATPPTPPTSAAPPPSNVAPSATGPSAPPSSPPTHLVPTVVPTASAPSSSAAVPASAPVVASASPSPVEAPPAETGVGWLESRQ